MIAPPVLVGVDVVEVDRISRAVAYSGPAYAHHVCAPDEQPLHEDPELATAATVAVKECLVKALGGRPPGFSWHDFTAEGDGGGDWARPLLDAAVPEFAATTDIALTRFSAYAVRGASAAAALARFPGGAGVAAAARWGWRGNLIVALAILTAFPEGAR
ncbi:4'-phosphopantetheinyl transferase superfamily protein [Actinokineospora sp. NPDC004072]